MESIFIVCDFRSMIFTGQKDVVRRFSKVTNRIAFVKALHVHSEVRILPIQVCYFYTYKRLKTAEAVFTCSFPSFAYFQVTPFDAFERIQS